MSPKLQVLISGCGIGGPALAFWLAKAGHSVTVVERAAELRTSGLQIDLRGPGIPVMKKMGIEEAVRAVSVNEEGIQFVARSGQRKAFLGANTSGQGRQSFTSEFEILRGDLTRILFDLTKDNDSVTYRFGTYVTGLDQKADSVVATFADGTTATYDLVVGADGQSSRTRRMMLADPEAEDAAFRPLGAYCAWYYVPDAEHQARVATVYHHPGRRVVATRRDNPDALQVYLATIAAPGEERAARLQGSIKEGDEAAQKRVWADIFQGVGERGDELVKGLEGVPDGGFYASEVAQVKTPTWHAGRIVLLGDAGYGPSPISGMGTTLAMTGAYILAGELEAKLKGCKREEMSGRLGAALAGYEEKLRPLVDSAQKLPPGAPRFAMPETEWGIWLLQSALGWAETLRIDKVVQYFEGSENGGWKLPEYEELEAKDGGGGE
jgi:2-polyprenyl-6-methoxyphenol hydroxylase-like FAD-dependent oxidoreductase